MAAAIAVDATRDADVHAARGWKGLTVLPLPPEQDWQQKAALRLGTLSPDVLTPTPQLLETLDRWGVRSLRALAMLPPLAITERLGQQGLQLQKLARGEGMRDLVPVSERFHFEETM